MLIYRKVTDIFKYICLIISSQWIVKLILSFISWFFKLFKADKHICKKNNLASSHPKYNSVPDYTDWPNNIMNFAQSLWTRCVHAKSLSHVRLFTTSWTIALQTPLSMRFSRQEYWSGLPCPPPGDLPNPGIKQCLLCLLHWQTGSSTTAPHLASKLTNLADGILSLSRQIFLTVALTIKCLSKNLSPYIFHALFLASYIVKILNSLRSLNLECKNKCAWREPKTS